jgi:dipeptidyl-peptidase-3
MKKLLTQIFLKFRFDFDFIQEDIESWNYFIKYFYRFIISDGFYDYSTSLKIKPEFTKKYWDKLLRHPCLGLQSFNNWYIATLDRCLFNDKYRSDIATSSNLYLGITLKEAEEYYKNKDALYENIKPKLLIGINTRLIKSISNIISEEYYMTYCSEPLNKMINNLILMKKLDYLANNKDDLEMIEKLILHLKNGSLSDYNDYLIKYASRKSKIEWILGFLDLKDDTLKRKGYLTGLVYLSEKKELLLKLGRFENNSSLIPQKSIQEQYSSKILEFTNYDTHFRINPIFLIDSKKNIRKINPTFNTFIMHTINNFNTVNSMPFLKI